jgi:hypothetical protein
MHVDIILGYKYSATLTGAVLKLVRCESCQVEYVYQMKRTGTGSGVSPLFLDNHGAHGRAAERAEKDLHARLEREVDSVPCPACGWYQSEMLPKARRDHGGWMRTVGLVLLIVAFITGMVAYSASMGPEVNRAWDVWSFGAAALVGGSVGAALLATKAYRSSRYDPNSADREDRIRAGQNRAVHKEEWEKMMQDRQPSPGSG